jgi:hypothetical protein
MLLVAGGECFCSKAVAFMIMKNTAKNAVKQDIRHLSGSPELPEVNALIMDLKARRRVSLWPEKNTN